VDLAVVSVAAIAAALPRLQTLTAVSWSGEVPVGAVAGFFDVLLPRLRVFHFSGVWPLNREGARGITAQPLPLLQELVWNCATSHLAEARGFSGAQPVKIHTTDAMIADWFATARSVRSTVVDRTAAGGGPLARVRDVRISGLRPFDSSGVARMLGAAPHLRALAIVGELQGSPVWYTVAGPDPCAVTLTHARVRSLVFQSVVDETRLPTADTATRLRKRHFPRLRELTVNSRQYHCVSLNT
jgi:hypothetical protein